MGNPESSDDQLSAQQSGTTATCSSCYLSNLLYGLDNVNVQCVGPIYVYMYKNLILLRFDKVGLTFLSTIWIIKIHPWRQSIVKTLDSDLRIYCYFLLVRSGTIYGFNYEIACLICHGLAILTMKLRFSISNLGTSAHIMCILSRGKITITID